MADFFQGAGSPHPDYKYQPQHVESAATKYTSETAQQTANRLQEAARQRLIAMGMDPGPPLKHMTPD